MSQLREIVTERLDSIPVPSPDPAGVRARAAAHRRARWTRVAAAGATGLVAAGVVVALVVSQTAGGSGGRGERRTAPISSFDVGSGLRAYADPGRAIHLGDKVFTATYLQDLDTDATATRYGVVFFDHQRPMLLAPSGHTRELGTGPEHPVSGWHPTAKADAHSPLVAWTERTGSQVTVLIYDLSRHQLVHQIGIDCSGDCPVTVDAMDQGTAFVRTPEGTRAWNGPTNVLIGGPSLRVADARNHVLLYDQAGAAPSLPQPGWRYVAGAIDSQLSFDGKYVLAWSNRLTPTTPGAAPVVLPVGRPNTQGFWTFDTDGSVLVATSAGSGAGGSSYDFHDCVIGQASCADLGPMKITGGDPAFIGDDM